MAKSFIIFILIFQFTFGLNSPVSYGHSDDLPNNSGGTNLFDDSARELESAADTDRPRNTPDPFHLVGQTLRLESGVVHSLSELNFSLPEIMVTDLQKEVTFASEPTTRSLMLTLKRKNHVIGTHVIPGFEPIVATQDKEFYVFLDRSGGYYAIDLGYAKHEAFRGPLPVIHLVDSAINFDKITDELQLQFLKRDQEPIALDPAANNGLIPLDDGRLMLAGNLLLTSKQSDGQYLLLEELSRAVLREQVFNTESVLAFLAMRLDPEKFNLKLMEMLSRGKLKDVAAQDQILENVASAKAVASLSSKTVTQLVARANINQNLKNERVDKFTLGEWKKYYEHVQDQQTSAEQAELELALINSQKSFSQKTFEAIRKQITPKSMKIMAGIIAGGAITYGGYELTQGHGPEWAVHAVNQFFDRYLNVLKDASYRRTLLYSSIALLSFIPLVWTAGFLAAKVKKTDWQATKMIAAAGMRTMGEIFLFLPIRIAKWTGQMRRVIEMRNGVSPLAASKQRKIGTIEALVEKKERIKALAWILASEVMSQKIKINSPQGVSINRESVENYIESSEFRAQWQQAAFEIYYKIKKNKNLADTPPEQLSNESRFELYQIAENVVKKIQSRGKIAQKGAKLLNGIRKFSTNLGKNIANFSTDEYNFLRDVEPGHFVVSQFWKQFVTDYFLAVVQMGLVGDRANLNRPEALAADPHGILWTNRGHFADMFGQVRIYGINVPARMALVYQKAASIIETSYAPIEDVTLTGTVKSEGFVKGMWAWAKGAANLEKADYGRIWFLGLKRSLNTLQAGVLLNVVERMVGGGQSLYDATMAFVYSMVWANWQFGWMWEPISRGNQMYEEHLAATSTQFTEAKTTLGSAIRFDDANKIKAGIDGIRSIYQKAKAKLPEDLEQSLKKVEAELASMDPATLNELTTHYNQSSELIYDLKIAIAQGDQEKIASVRQKLQQAYEKAGATAESLGLVLKLNAVSLLEYTLKHPPFATKAHKKVEWVTTMLGAVLTTYYATSLSVDTFAKDVDWPTKIGWAFLFSSSIYFTTYHIPTIYRFIRKLFAGKSKQGTNQCGELMNGSS